MSIVLISVGYAFNALVTYSKDTRTEQVECTVVASGEQEAIGDVFVFNVDGLKSTVIQKSQCFNMEDVKVGDTFGAVAVYDENDIFQCFVKVTY